MNFSDSFLKIIDRIYKYSRIKKDLESGHKSLLFKERENIALQSLMHFFGSGVYIAYTNMSMSPLTISHILNEININKRKSIIEFGAGNSTLFIAKLLQSSSSDIVFYSVESDEEWIEILRAKLLKKGLARFVNFIHAPTKQHMINGFGEQRMWYDSEVIAKSIDGKKFDLVIVDGPLGTLAPLSRYPAIPFLDDHLQKSFAVFLDDYHRNDERQIAARWAKQLKNSTLTSEMRYAVIAVGSNFLSSPL